MNSFALLQDDVEDSPDLKASTPDAKPAEVVQDARAAPDERKPTPVPDAAAPAVDPTSADAPDKPRPPPKEKDLSLEEYLAQKAQKSSSLTSLSKGARKANDGISTGFEKMSLLKKDNPSNRPDADSLMASVAVKEVHENKALKDSTHAAVAKNAEIQSFFKRDPVSDRRQFTPGSRRGSDFRRGAYDTRRGARGGAPRPDSDSRGKIPDDRPARFEARGGTYEPRGGRGDARGGKFEDRGGRFEGRGGRYERGMDRDYRRDQRGAYGRGNRGADADGPNGHPQGPRSYGNGPKGPSAPNVDDTAAFPSL